MNNKAQNFIEKIVELKTKDLEEQKKDVSLEELQNDVLRVKKSEGAFIKKFENKNKVGLITEIKFASPTQTDLGKHEDLLVRVKEYKKSGADAISLITEKHYFKGDGRFVSKVKKEISLPILQKDFVIDPYQIYEAKQFGSDALLLIARLIDKETLKEFVALCSSLGIEPVVEINNKEDLKRALETGTNIIAVNARDFVTLEVSVSDACILMKQIPNTFTKLGFSGIHSADEVAFYKNAGANGILIGTSLMQAENIGSFIKSLEL